MARIEDLINRCGNDSMLLGAVQELQQYRENPLARMQPCWRYVQRNGVGQQLDYIAGEIREVEQALTADAEALECWDVLQASLTLFHIAVNKYCADAEAIVKAGQAKNNARGYYEKGGGTDGT